MPVPNSFSGRAVPAPDCYRVFAACPGAVSGPRGKVPYRLLPPFWPLAPGSAPDPDCYRLSGHLSRATDSSARQACCGRVVPVPTAAAFLAACPGAVPRTPIAAAFLAACLAPLIQALDKRVAGGRCPYQLLPRF